MEAFAERLTSRLEPWLTSDLEIYCRAVGVMFDPVLELVEEEGTDGQAGFVPAWGRLLDVDLCPAYALPYLAMYVGVQLPTGASETEARELIRAESGQERGTRKSVEQAIERNLATIFNLVPEPSFEYYAAGWEYTGSWVASGAEHGTTDAERYIGQTGLYLRTAKEYEGAWINLPFTFEAGKAYTLSMYLKGATSSAQVQLGLGVLPGAGDHADTVVIKLTTEWERYTVTWTPAETVASAEASVRGTSAVAQELFVDAVQVLEGSEPVTYEDGDQPGFIWLGTAGASASGKRGSHNFFLIERRNAEGAEDPYHFQVIVAPEEVLSKAALIAAINAVKPGGLFYTLVETTGFTWSEATHTWEEDTMSWLETAHVEP